MKRIDLRGRLPTHSPGHENCVICRTRDVTHVDVTERAALTLRLDGSVVHGDERHVVYCCAAHSTIGAL